MAQVIGTSARLRSLTPGERKYLLDAALGLTAQQSAHRWGVTVNTTNTMRVTARRALGAASIAHAVALAFLYGEITTDEIRGTS